MSKQSNSNVTHKFKYNVKNNLHSSLDPPLPPPIAWSVYSYYQDKYFNYKITHFKEKYFLPL